jgi:hypothetical protein
MKLNTPSYGVFMVDVFASSVGIFILVSLLYIIESGKTTASEEMVERFETLVKRDKIPVDRYSLPHSADPLHDWGVRARHARDKREALILLLRDKILLYNTMETLDVNDIVDSDKIREYYDRYNKNGRLILEIHYHDAYHMLKAKIHEALPPNVHLWSHWAYNAGNINNPNPILRNANTNRLSNQRPRDPNQPIGDSDGVPSSLSTDANSSGVPGGEPGSPQNNNGTPGGSDSGQPQDDETQSGEGESEGQGEGTADGSNSQWPKTDDAAGDRPGQQSQSKAVQAEVARQLNKNGTAKQFIEQFMAQSGSATESEQSEQDNNPTEQPPTNEQPTLEEIEPFPTMPETPPVEALAQEFIQKNAFLTIPLFSPIDNFVLNVKVPGFESKRFTLTGAHFKMHQQPNEQSRAAQIKLDQGDTINPLAVNAISGHPSNKASWMQVRVMQLQDLGNPKTGWIYGFISGEQFMLPLFENTIESSGNTTADYWFKPVKEQQTTEQMLNESTEQDY